MAKKNKKKISNRRKRKQKKKNNNQAVLLLVGVLAIAALAFVFWPKAGSVKASSERIAQDPFLGQKVAKVTILEYSDFGCPSCRAWHNAGILDRIMENYGDEVKFVWKDFPVITPQSPKAAEAGQCALDQGKFWEYHDLIYTSQGLGISSLKRFAQEVGLDTNKFDKCLDSGLHKSTVDKDLNEARGLRLRGTPSFIVNGTKLVGPPSYESLANIIENNLAKGN